MSQAETDKITYVQLPRYGRLSLDVQPITLNAQKVSSVPAPEVSIFISQALANIRIGIASNDAAAVVRSNGVWVIAAVTALTFPRRHLIVGMVVPVHLFLAACRNCWRRYQGCKSDHC
jgi:hypothetical protein